MYKQPVAPAFTIRNKIKYPTYKSFKYSFLYARIGCVIRSKNVVDFVKYAKNTNEKTQNNTSCFVSGLILKPITTFNGMF